TRMRCSATMHSGVKVKWERGNTVRDGFRYPYAGPGDSPCAMPGGYCRHIGRLTNVRQPADMAAIPSGHRARGITRPGVGVAETITNGIAPFPFHFYTGMHGR